MEKVYVGWWVQSVVTQPGAPGLWQHGGVAEEAWPLCSDWEARRETKRLQCECPRDPHFLEPPEGFTSVPVLL